MRYCIKFQRENCEKILKDSNTYCIIRIVVARLDTNKVTITVDDHLKISRCDHRCENRSLTVDHSP